MKAPKTTPRKPMLDDAEPQPQPGTCEGCVYDGEPELPYTCLTCIRNGALRDNWTAKEERAGE